jgi:hypothetical protein
VGEGEEQENGKVDCDDGIDDVNYEDGEMIKHKR